MVTLKFNFSTEFLVHLVKYDSRFGTLTWSSQSPVSGNSDRRFASIINKYIASHFAKTEKDIIRATNAQFSRTGLWICLKSRIE